MSIVSADFSCPYHGPGYECPKCNPTLPSVTKAFEEMKTPEDVVKVREGLYGHPYDNFANIAALWSDYLNAREAYQKFPRREGEAYQFEFVLTREDVAHMMILLKVARTINTPYNEDNPVDIAGYARCIQMIKEKENE